VVAISVVDGSLLAEIDDPAQDLPTEAPDPLLTNDYVLMNRKNIGSRANPSHYLRFHERHLR